MNSLNEKTVNTDIYEHIQRAPMSEREREVALSAVRNAESIVDGGLWAVDALKALIASVLEKPADLKHSH